LTKGLLVVCDGLGDRPVPSLKGKTPLEYANIPNLNALARKGIQGLVDVIGPGIIPGSDAGHLSLFGYRHEEYYSGRGPFEALGLGMKLKPNDIAFRCNFATVDAQGTVTDRRAGRYIDEAKELASAVNGIKFAPSQEVEISFHESIEHRGVLVLSGPNLSDQVSETDPHRNGEKIRVCKPLDSSKEASRTATIVNEFSKRARKVLANHPANQRRSASGRPVANALLLRGPGKVPHIPSLYEKYGVKSACVAGIKLIKGVAEAVGMDIIDVPTASGGIQTDFKAKAKATVSALKTHDFVFLHFKGTDVAGHDALAEAKVHYIENVDGAIGDIFSDLGAEEEVVFALTADHATPVTVKEHTADPVPLLVSADFLLSDGCDSFSERDAMHGGMSRLRGLDLMPILMNYLGRAPKIGE
jgi:2,3-bisphosphoglycerate-independent phosphoglycerate mutase